MERSARFNSLQGNTATQLYAFAYLLRQWAAPLWLNIDPSLPLQRDFFRQPAALLFFARCSHSCWPAGANVVDQLRFGMDDVAVDSVASVPAAHRHRQRPTDVLGRMPLFLRSLSN